ncbi:MAG: SDR family NAD(P)-dependent oxidoreductase [Alphaproteobacteria bacterium]
MIPAQKPDFRHVAITGASSGIGEALALHYSRIPGMRLSLAARNEERLRTVTHACRNEGAETVMSLLDVTDENSVKTWVETMDEERSIDLIIANAGISAGTAGSATGENAHQVSKLFAANLNGVLNTINPVLPLMIRRGKGHIALMSSLAAFRGWPGAPAYCASKAAVKVYGEGLAGAIAETGVKVHVICPGFVKSPMTAVNHYKMPFMISAERAASIIARGIDMEKGRIAFPLRSFLIVQGIGLLPDALAQRILTRMPQKSS